MCFAPCVPGSRHLPLAELPADRRIVRHCAGGSRPPIAAGLLRGHGHPGVHDLIGGYAAWSATPDQ
ncbi:rhodanese-like domain-containing protein [Kitasatospora sp. NPDC086791]|uniref:rhodanese-like domain-containing protein n=1 Tax=Kitasatospora sp. NPDC086791 TaxID=3155178 RepID=UPI00342746B4